jgi:hypothetical protein
LHELQVGGARQPSLDDAVIVSNISDLRNIPPLFLGAERGKTGSNKSGNLNRCEFTSIKEVPVTISSKKVTEVVLKMFSAQELSKMTRPTLSALARRAQVLREDKVELTPEVLREQRRQLEMSHLSPALRSLHGG